MRRIAKSDDTNEYGHDSLVGFSKAGISWAERNRMIELVELLVEQTPIKGLDFILPLVKPRVRIEKLTRERWKQKREWHRIRTRFDKIHQSYLNGKAISKIVRKSY